MELIEFGALSEERRAELEGEEPDPWDSARLPLRFAWRPKERHVALQAGDGRLVAVAGAVAVELETDAGVRVDAVGIGGVIVAAEHRGRGLSTPLIAAVLRLAESLGPDVALLFCHRDRASLYARHGFREVDAPVLVESPEGVIPMPMLTMWRPLRASAILPRGQLRLIGAVF